MAEAILLAVATNLGTMVKEKAVNDYGLLVGVQAEVETLRFKLEFIKKGLHDAELQQTEEESVKSWMESLKQIKYDAEDVLDEWRTRDEIFNSQKTEASDFSNKLFLFFSSKYCSCFEPFLPILFGNNFQLLSCRVEIARKIQVITASLDTLCEDMQQLKPISNTTHRDTHLHSGQMTSLMVDVSEVYGRGADKKIIVDWLLSESSEPQKEVPVISIAGFDGIGKTTLAKLVLKDEAVVTAFRPNIWWVCVSKCFDCERLAREIVEQATGKKPAADAWNMLHNRLKESVRGKKFLLVLDDVWSINEKNWADLKIALANPEQGSRIVITTCNGEVAQVMGCTRTHELKKLSDADCSSLFQSIAFLGRSKDEIARCKEIGEQLTQKCAGLPLAVDTLAKYMRRKKKVRDWKNVLTNEVWKIKNKFFPSLLLSFQALPSSVKQCFVYCSIFPKGTKMKKDELVKLWMAQGFLESPGRQDFEMVGTEYFDNLVMASFFQDLERHDGDGRIVSCKMHDLVHDFAQSLSGKESFVTGVNSFDEVCWKQVRHMNVQDKVNFSIYQAKNLRTMIDRQGQVDKSDISNQFTCLRSLVLSCNANVELPSGVGRLLHLRYLDLSESTDLEELPDTLCGLYNLQTLMLYKNRRLRSLPKEIGKLSNLRHLDIRETDQLRCIPQSIGRLSKLRSLSNFKVSGGTMSAGCKIGELGSLNHLSGKLELSGLDHVGSVDEAKSATLQKKNLRCLKLDFEYVSGEDGMERQKEVLEGLQPELNLERLAITDYQGSIFPSWMSSKPLLPRWMPSEPLLPNLVKIKLNNCKNCEELPPLGNFKYLETLHIWRLESVKQIASQFYGVEGETSFPNLKKLVLRRMKELVDWEIPFSNLRKVMPRLRSLELEHCPKLMKLPALGRLESLENIWFDQLDTVKRVGTEFVGHGGKEEIVFPKLKKLAFRNMVEWEEWDLPLALCSLRDLSIVCCPMLKTLTAALSKLQSLESLYVSDIKGVNNVGVDILGISDGCAVIAATGDGESLTTSSSSSPDLMLFPNLKDLILGDFPEWEGDEDIEITTCTIFPGLQKLEIKKCYKLKMVPHYMISRSLRKLALEKCPELEGIQPCLPPQLEELNFHGDIGVLSNSLLPIIAKGNNNDDNNYPNLKSIGISYSPHSSLPQGINKFISLKYLQIDSCDKLDLKPDEELRYFPMLQRLWISECPKIRERFNKEDWGNNLSYQIPFKTSFLGMTETDGNIILTRSSDVF